MANDLIWNIIISLYNDIFDNRKGNNIIYNHHFCIELKILILFGGMQYNLTFCPLLLYGDICVSCMGKDNTRKQA